MVSNWFEQLGHECPYGINIADFILDLASGRLALRPNKIRLLCIIS